MGCKGLTLQTCLRFEVILQESCRWSSCPSLESEERDSDDGFRSSQAHAVPMNYGGVWVMQTRKLPSLRATVVYRHCRIRGHHGIWSPRSGRSSPHPWHCTKVQSPWQVTVIEPKSARLPFSLQIWVRSMNDSFNTHSEFLLRLIFFFFFFDWM